jgi:FKBP-type peptidyl-prolyl cis-trans isomerase
LGAILSSSLHHDPHYESAAHDTVLTTLTDLSLQVHCTGYGKDRDLTKQFWSTKDAGQQPFTFAVGTGGVIKGWDESVIDMSIGEVAKIHCSPDYAYGPGGFPAWGIQPNSELIFEIEVLSYA